MGKSSYDMDNIFYTDNSRNTQKLGEILAEELLGGEIICLSGELGSGKTTFAQGALKGLGAKGPYASPTFVVMKHYTLKNNKHGIRNVYHIDAYRIGEKDIVDLSWREIIADKKNITIVEWADRLRRIVPERAVWIKFRHKGKYKREITLTSKLNKTSV